MDLIIIINPLTARVVGAPEMILQPVSPFFPVLHYPLGLAELQACPFPNVSHSQHRKNRERFWKNAGEWTGSVEISKEEIPGSKRSMCGYILTYSRL